VDRRGLADVLPLVVGAPLTEEDLAEARRRLEEMLIFRSVALDLVDQPDGVRVVARLGRKPVIARVRVEGYDGVQLKELRWLLNKMTGGALGGGRPHELGRVEMRRLVQLREGVLFEPAMLERAEQRILERFYKLGFAYTQTSSRVHEERGTVEITLRIDPGEPVVVETVELAGDSCLPAADWEPVVAPFRGVPRGRGIERKARSALLRHLREEGYFEARVNTSWVPDGELRGRVRAELSCGLPHEITFSGNAHVSEKELRGALDLAGRLIINASTWRLMARRMEDLYQAKGYYKARVKASIEGDTVRKRISFAVEEGRVYRLRSTTVRGNAHATEKELRAQMETRRARLFPWPRRGAVLREHLDEDLQRIEALYHGRGFEAARAKAEVVERGGGDLELRLTIDEGLRTVIRRVEPSEFPAPVEPAQPLASAVGQPLRPADLERDREAVLAGWRALGHRDARVAFAVERREAGEEIEAGVRWTVAPGPRFVVGRILVQENFAVRNKLLLREMPFATGDPLRVETLLQGQERLYSLGLFRNATVGEIESGPPEPGDRGDSGEDNAAPVPAGGAEPARAAPARMQESREPARADLAASPGVDSGDDAPQAGEEAAGDVAVPIGIRVTQRAPGRLSYGAGYNTRDGFTGFTELRYDNLARRARSLRLRGEVSLEPPSFAPSQYLASLSYLDPRFGGSPWALQLGVVGERNTRSVSEFSIERAALGASVSRRLFDRVRVGSDLQLELARIFDVEPLPFRDRDSENLRTTAIGGFVAYDRRNDAFNPTSGFIDSLRLYYAPPGISNVDFVQIDAEHTHFFPLGDYADFVVSLRAGWVRTFDDPIVPIRRRYFVGGGESVRGFAVNHLGPYDGEGKNVGGDLALVARTELRVPIAWGFGMAFFVDGGGNYLLRCDRKCRAGDPEEEATRVRDAEASLRNFRRSAGLGLRYASPVGPISVDYGIKLDRRTRDLADGKTERESFGEFSVSIGARF
jgi:outer membrane protein assembly factor BamA